MADTAARNASYDDLLRVPAHLVAEIVGGRLVTHPRPAPRHAVVSSLLGIEVGKAFFSRGGDPGGWWILDEPELHLDADVLVPDLAGWRRERMPKLPDTPWFELAPDWICEVLSPSTARDDRVVKMPLYARAGVEYLWLIDPDQKTIEVFALERGRWMLLGAHKDDEQVRLPPFDALALDLAILWP